ncbi:MAG: selenoneine biosynthesis selenosugar synthase SenB [Burkholderiaceae bacterium]
MVCIVTPALADANNGNWQTAQRWARMLAEHYQVQLTDRWQLGDPAPEAMIALHARRSAASIQAFADAYPDRPLIVALTGTDLYHDIHHDESAQRSLALADRLIVLHERAPLDLPAEYRAKTVACFQSTETQAPILDKSAMHLRALAVGHLRAEKSPQTLFEAARLLVARGRDDICIDHIGAALDAALGREAEALDQSNANYRWLGALPHEATRRCIQGAHVLVHPSLMEGGAHVVMEAVCSGTPVLASRISGNVGMLGEHYDGYFPPGDAAAAAALLMRCRDEPAMLRALTRQCAARAHLFEPPREQATLLKLLKGELASR